jgi:hypothetical protein
MRPIVILLLAASGALVCGSARADVDMCNQTSKGIWTIWGSWAPHGVNCTLNTYGGDDWEGWYYAAPNSCVTVFSGCYITAYDWLFGDGSPAPFIAYAATNDDGTTWGNGAWGDNPTSNDAFFYCVNPGSSGPGNQVGCESPCPSITGYMEASVYNFGDSGGQCNITINFDN